MRHIHYAFGTKMGDVPEQAREIDVQNEVHILGLIVAWMQRPADAMWILFAQTGMTEQVTFHIYVKPGRDISRLKEWLEGFKRPSLSGLPPDYVRVHITAGVGDKPNTRPPIDAPVPYFNWATWPKMFPSDIKRLYKALHQFQITPQPSGPTEQQ